MNGLLCPYAWTQIQIGSSKPARYIYSECLSLCWYFIIEIDLFVYTQITVSQGQINTLTKIVIFF